MRFLTDENCDFAIVRALRDAGHDVTTIKDTAPGASDETVIRMTLDEDRILVTEDRDFGRLVFASGMDSLGVLYLRFPASARQTMVDTVADLVKREDSRLDRCFVVVQPSRTRITERHDND